MHQDPSLEGGTPLRDTSGGWVRDLPTVSAMGNINLHLIVIKLAVLLVQYIEHCISFTV